MTTQGMAKQASARTLLSGGGERGLYLGRYLDDEAGQLGDKLIYGGERHAILFGPNGSGKGTRFLMVNLLGDYLAGRSVIVIDPKGELAAVTAKFRHELHGPGSVQILDPFGKLREAVGASPAHRYLVEHGLIDSAGFNPFDALDPGTEANPNPNFYDDAAAIGEALIKIEGKDPHWPESAQGLAVALVMWEKLRNGNNANLENVREMLTEPEPISVSLRTRLATAKALLTQRPSVPLSVPAAMAAS